MPPASSPRRAELPPRPPPPRDPRDYRDSRDAPKRRLSPDRSWSTYARRRDDRDVHRGSRDYYDRPISSNGSQSPRDYRERERDRDRDRERERERDRILDSTSRSPVKRERAPSGSPEEGQISARRSPPRRSPTLKRYDDRDTERERERERGFDDVRRMRDRYDPPRRDYRDRDYDRVDRDRDRDRERERDNIPRRGFPDSHSPYSPRRSLSPSVSPPRKPSRLPSPTRRLSPPRIPRGPSERRVPGLEDRTIHTPLPTIPRSPAPVPAAKTGTIIPPWELRKVSAGRTSLPPDAPKTERLERMEREKLRPGVKNIPTGPSSLPPIPQAPSGRGGGIQTMKAEPMSAGTGDKSTSNPPAGRVSWSARKGEGQGEASPLQSSTPAPSNDNRVDRPDLPIPSASDKPSPYVTVKVEVGHGSNPYAPSPVQGTSHSTPVRPFTPPLISSPMPHIKQEPSEPPPPAPPTPAPMPPPLPAKDPREIEVERIMFELPPLRVSFGDPVREAELTAHLKHMQTLQNNTMQARTAYRHAATVLIDAEAERLAAMERRHVTEAQLAQAAGQGMSISLLGALT
ncbi:hypothetical protein TREMEDRAFT_58917 [Tremella mesenterica DSM 1558]|uniref:uncharacterized protein n=1 Tax=Tremella mesenterica (strain ATCC 24925 / CBS 8224 / DSM 1558 / NBRC 9311 / NRRL Y-6157 / RJB 2259-6 / UBC 559-6) TaxID=578456 RepID=UPI0003F48DDB|nr:uncharacterized protein TREMEDRAFT_58917 [Tremella mesenterica DSM 1558]EIW72750.1 hypothetical protein TREMEDRAFT_58917 [Tremella mesenterica DSM 1558]